MTSVKSECDKRIDKHKQCCEQLKVAVELAVDTALSVTKLQIDPNTNPFTDDKIQRIEKSIIGFVELEFYFRSQIHLLSIAHLQRLEGEDHDWSNIFSTIPNHNFNDEKKRKHILIKN